jgi:hypothetical protein
MFYGSALAASVGKYPIVGYFDNNAPLMAPNLLRILGCFVGHDRISFSLGPLARAALGALGDAAGSSAVHCLLLDRPAAGG